MKTFKTILLITGILVAGLAFNSVAQTPEKEKSHKEAYAFNHEKNNNKHKIKAHKSDHKAKAKPHAKHKSYKNKDKHATKARLKGDKD